MTRKELEETRAEVRVKDRELEESEERHMMEVKVYKQKVKHLLYEQENNIAELKAENMVSLKVSVHKCVQLYTKPVLQGGSGGVAAAGAESPEGQAAAWPTAARQGQAVHPAHQGHQAQADGAGGEYTLHVYSKQNRFCRWRS